MTREEKLEEAKRLYKTANADQRYVLESLFPELAESEDERVRKALVKAVSGTHKGNKLFGTDVTREEALAWLEKQGKHKDYYTKQELIAMGFSFTLNGDIVTPDEMMEDMKKYLAWKEKQGKPKWSEEDAFRTKTLTETVIGGGFIRFEMRNEFVDWLKSLKQRLGGEE